MNLDDTLAELNRKHREANRFTVVCCITRQTRWVERIIVRNLPYDDAQRLAKRLQERYDLRHPNHSSWTARHYWARLGRPLPVKHRTRDPWSQL